MSADAVIGVDAGGSKTVARLVLDGVATDVAAWGGAANPARVGVADAANTIAEAVTELMRRVEVLPSRVACGVAGCGARKLRDELRLTLSGLLGTPVFVTTDAEAALLATALTGPAAVLIAGTGSIALSRGESGRVTRAGGLGPLGGDPGSGPWIAARHASSARAEDVDRAAVAGDALCVRLLEEAAHELADLVTAVTSPDLQAPLGLVGGVLDGSTLVRATLLDALSLSRPLLTPAPPEVPPEVGALRASP